MSYIEKSLSEEALYLTMLNFDRFVSLTSLGAVCVNLRLQQQVLLKVIGAAT